MALKNLIKETTNKNYSIQYKAKDFYYYNRSPLLLKYLILLRKGDNLFQLTHKRSVFRCIGKSKL